MKMQRSLFNLRTILLLSTVLAIGGCSDFAPVVREFTYPPDFKYVSGQELRSRMDQLAYQLQLLDQALAQSDAALALARQLGHPPSLASAMAWTAVLHSTRRDVRAAREHAEERPSCVPLPES